MHTHAKVVRGVSDGYLQVSMGMYGIYLVEASHYGDWYIMVTVHLRSCKGRNSSQLMYTVPLSLSFFLIHLSLSLSLSTHTHT